MLSGSVQPRGPRYLTAPLRISSAGPECVELAESAGLILDPWQAADIEVWCGEAPRATSTGEIKIRWAALEVAELVARQNGKGAILEARQLGGLYLFGERLQTHTAHRVDTCLEHFRRVKHLITETPDLSRHLRKITETNGAEAIELMNGNRLIFKARSKGSGRGFSGTTIYLDEAFYLLTISGMLPTMSAQPNPQLVYTSSAPLEGPESAILRRLVKRGRAGSSPRLAYIEYSADPKAASDSLEALADGNPSLPIRITEEFSATEREAMPDEEYRRERLGIVVFPEDVPEEEWVIDATAWKASGDPASGPDDDEPVRLALDVSVDRRWAAFGAAGPARGAPGVVHVEVADYNAGVNWVVEAAVDLQDQWGGPLYIAAKSPASALKPDLDKAGVVVELVTVEQHAEWCGILLDAVIENRVRHLDEDKLNAAVAGAVQRFYSGDTWLWSRRSSAVDICPLVAVTLAAGALARPVTPKPPPDVHAWADDDEEFNAILRQLNDEEGDGLDAP